MLSKSDLRAAFRQARHALSETEVVQRSALIIAQVEALVAPRGCKTVHCYEPIAGLHEIDVGPLIEWLEARRVIVYTSRYIGDSWQVVTRSGHTPERPVHYDCIILPMLGFDRRLHRLGQGGGYYDRLLSGQPQAFKLGVCFELGKVPELPAEPHDVSLDVVVTEAAVYRA